MQILEQAVITVFYRVQCALFYKENDAEIFPAHYTWKVAKKAFKMAFMMNKFPMINSCEIFLKKGQKSLLNSIVHYTCMRIILNKIWYQSWMTKLDYFQINIKDE